MQTFTTYKKYPYAGFSQNLMEYFYIIGYSKDKINNIPVSKSPICLGEPEILSIVNNSNQVKVVESEIILKQIFPTNPPIIELNNDSPNQNKPKKSTVMFMLNPDDYNQPIKNPSCCSALVFYEPQKANSKLYVPKAFCVVSQFPYFSFFNELNKKFLDLFKKEMEIPIEIVIYNMINFIPSPINFELELNVFPNKGSKYVEAAAVSENQNSNSIKDSIISNSSNNYNNNSKNNIVNNNNNNDKARTNSIISKTSTNSANSNNNGNNNNNNNNNSNSNNSININNNISNNNTNNNSNNNNNNNNYPIYKLKQLTGYPQMDIDISKLFNILSVENTIELFIMLLMEIDVIFFSKNLEILNPVMYILSKLTFPCDDSMYQWNIVTVSKAEFSTDNLFTGKPGTLMVGVNCTYDSTIETIRVRGNNIVVDLDNKKIEFITTSQEEYDQMNNFRKFIRQCIFPQTNYNYLYFNQNSANGCCFFYKEFLSKLYSDLCFVLNKKAVNGFNNNINSNNNSNNNNTNNANSSGAGNGNNSNSNSANEKNTNASSNNNTNNNSNNSNNNIANNIAGNLNYFLNANYNSGYNNSSGNQSDGNSSLLDFFDYKDIERIYKFNKEIQEIFFNFMIKLLTVFYNFFKLKSISEKNIDVSDEKNSFFIKCSDKLNDNDFFELKFNALNEHEKFFFNNFISTKRYDKYFLGYIVKNEVNKMHRMAYHFSEEYVYIQKTASVDLNHSIYQEENCLRTLSLIDLFYSHYTQISNIIQKSEYYNDFKIYNEEHACYQQLKNLFSISKYQNETGKVYSQADKIILTLNFDEFYKIYFDSLIKDIMKFDNINQQESVVNLITNYAGKKMISYEYCEFENSFLFNYFYYLNNFCEAKPREDIFVYDKICKINSIPSIKSTDVSDLIENEFLKFSNLNIDNAIIYSLVNLFLIVIAENCTSEIYSSLKEILNTIKGKNIFVRKYLELILNTYIDPRFTGELCETNSKEDIKQRKPSNDETSEEQNKNSSTSGCKATPETNQIHELSSSQKSFLGKRTSSYYVMINFIREQDILPTENFLKILNYVNNCDNKSSPEFGLMDRDDEEANFSTEISFLYNRCKCGFKKKDYFIAETLNFEANQNVIVNCRKCKIVVENTKFNIKLISNSETLVFQSEIFSVRKILQTSKDILQEYLKHFELKKLDLDLLKKLILNMIFYCDKDSFKIIKGFLLKSFKSVNSKISI